MEMPINVKRAAAYCRVSTDLEIQEGSFELQKRYYKELLSARRDVELVRIYGDEGSGRSIRHRPEFSQMLSDCEAGQIDVIYTKSFSRFSRSLIDFVTVIRRLRELGIPVIFEKEGINSMDSQNELLMHILAIVAQEESKSIAENVKWSIEKRHSEGKPTGKVPYGYRRIDGNGHWSIEDGEADRVRLAFSRAESGACYQAIRAELDEIETREHTGISWSHNRSRLPLMLKNVAYIGDCITDNYYTAYNKDGHRYSKRNRGERDQYLIEQHHEAIISREQFYKVQTMIRLGLLHSGRKSV